MTFDYTALVASSAGRYPTRWAREWAAGKMRGDPVFRAVLDELDGLIPLGGPLVDVGCGEGYLLVLSRGRWPELELLGLDHDTRRLDLGRAALSGDARARFVEQDARAAALSGARAIALLDVLHYLAPDDQDALVATLAAALAPGGCLLVRDATADGGWRSHITRWSEQLLVGIGRHRGAGVFLRSTADLEGALTRAGLQVTRRPCHAGTPFANILLIGRQPE